MKYKILATDIDGTITDAKGRIHLQAVEWIRKLEEKGNPVILVSGRPLPYIESLSLYLGTSGPIIAENGAVAKMNGEIFLFGSAEPAQKAISELQKVFPIQLDNDNPYRLVDISFKKNIEPQLLENFIKDQGFPVSLLITNVMYHLVDHQVSKGKTLLKIIQELNILPSETVVCGDSFNDLTLFEIGACNLAVANAEPALKTKAAHIAEYSYGEGFAQLMGKIF